MNRSKTDALTATVDRDFKNELENPTKQTETGSQFPSGWIDDRVLPKHRARGRQNQSGIKGG